MIAPESMVAAERIGIDPLAVEALRELRLLAEASELWAEEERPYIRQAITQGLQGCIFPLFRVILEEDREA